MADTTPHMGLIFEQLNTAADQETVAFTQSCESQPDVNYDWVWEYARERYKSVCATTERLDQKADAIIRYVGVIAGFFSAVALFQVSAKNVWVAIAFAPAFLASLVAIIAAASVRRPQRTEEPSTIRTAFEYANHFKDPNDAKGRFSATIHRSCVSIRKLNDYKADCVELATNAFVIAIALLLAPFVTSIVLLGTKP